MASLRIAKVVKVLDKGRACDIVFVDNGAQASKVQVMSPDAATDCGVSGLITPTEPDEPYGAKTTEERIVYAAVGFVAGNLPVILGFFYPQVSQMMFDRPNFRIYRHPSDVYVTFNDAGDVEVFHPSGTYLRIGEDPAHEDLEGQDFDQKFAITRNTDKEVHVKLQVRNGGEDKASLHILPTGDVQLTTVADVTATVGGDVALSVSGSITSSAAAWNHTGDIVVDGEVTANGIELSTHTHTEQGDGAETSGPN